MMKIIGDVINKIEAQRVEKLEQPLQVKTNVHIKSVIQKELFTPKGKQQGVALEYEFKVNYGENSANILVEGTLFALADAKELAEINKGWNVNKLKPEIVVQTLNRAMHSAYLVAIPLSKDLRLPAPVRFPVFRKEQGKSPKDVTYVG